MKDACKFLSPGSVMTPFFRIHVVQVKETSLRASMPHIV